MVADADLLSPELVEDPYPYFRQLREEDPVHWSPRYKAWLVTRYDDVVGAARDPALSSDRMRTFYDRKLSPEEQRALEPIGRLLARWIVFRDPPEHGRLRRLVRHAFTPRMVQSLEEDIRAIVDRLLEDLPRIGEPDLLRDFAYPLPATVIARMLGVPEGDIGRFRQWSTEMAPFVFGTGAPGRREGAAGALLDLEGYLGGLLEEYRKHPQDNLLAALARARDEEDFLDDDEIVATSILLLFAGHETTTSLITSGFFLLDRHPEERDRLARDPSLAASAVEEFLRYESPSKLMVRIASDDTTVGGREIRAGERVFLVLASANRDPRKFADPERLDVARNDDTHLGFGFGIHFCLGASLARLEARIAFDTLLERHPKLRVAGGRPDWVATLLGRGLRSLPVVFG